MVVASGLDKHGSGADIPLKYTHLDIAGSAGNFPGPATGAPILALANAYILWFRKILTDYLMLLINIT